MRTTLEMNTKDLPEIWQAAYRILGQTVISTQLVAWVQPLEFLGTEPRGGRLVVKMRAPNVFSMNWLKDNHQRNLNDAFTQVIGMACDVEISLRLESDGEAADSFTLPESMVLGESSATVQESFPPPSVSVPSPAPQLISMPARSSRELSLEPRYTFSSFVVGASNQFAQASAVAVAEQPARQYNPLFLYSPPGLGKTHLLHAIGNHFLSKHPQGRVGYLSAERFVNELVESVQKFKMPQFRSKYRDSFDLLLIDDIQFIAKKTASEEEFFHTFNALHSSKRQIVVTSDRSPKEIDGLEERVRTRFEWGLIADITPPEIETRIAILKTKAERDDIYLPDDVATFLGSYVKSNVRELEGILIRLQAQASLTGAEISLVMAKHELKVSVPDEGSSFTVESIQNAASKYFKIKVQDLRSTSRARTVALPRQVAMYLARKYTGLGFREIGGYFGGKDHSTVMHGCRKIEEEIESNDEIRQAVESIQNLL